MYRENIYFLTKIKTLLVLDQSTTHKTSKVNDKIKECETALSFPSDLTWRLQSLDISINKVFKESLRNKHVGYWICKNNIKGLKSVIVDWIDELWHSHSVITSEIIFNTFKYSRISHSLDGNEDDQFREYKDIEKGNEIFQI